MKLKLVRLEQTDQGTLGILLLNRKVFCFTLELPWRDNKKNISCIPAGKYKCHRIITETRNTFEIEMPGRTEILFHSGNTIDDIKGCILLGKEQGYINNKRAIFTSKITCSKFMQELEGINIFELEIKECYA